MDSKLIVALDVENKDKAKKILEVLHNKVKIFKVGPYLYSKYGPDIIKLIKDYNCEVFLDLKLHDIPNTVKHSVKQMVNLGVYMLTVHISGGEQMMKQAQSTAKKLAEKSNIRKPLILGITVLSSLDETDLSDMNIKVDSKEQVLHLAKLARKSQLDGVVASAKEAIFIRKQIGSDFIIATPGIRLRKESSDDQKRTATPKEAFDNGADYIIVGRPIIKADDFLKAAEGILNEIN